MLNELSVRHRGDLGGRLTDVRLPAKVIVAVSPEVANTATGQHLTWMLLNLLARQTAEIAQIELLIPRGVERLANLSPMITQGPDLYEYVRDGVSTLNPSVFAPSSSRSEIFVRVGPGELDGADFALATTASGWCGCVSQVGVDTLDDTPNPIGAYLAASLCAGEIFKFVRGMLPTAGDFAHHLWLDGYNFDLSKERPLLQPLPENLRLQPTIVAGVGAVTNGFLHVLYALAAITGELTVIDGDPEGIIESNLNRYVLFGLSDLHQPKASAAANIFSGRLLRVIPVNSSWQSWMTTRLGQPLKELVISAVDKNSARHAIQDALPRLILGASTNEMRAQVNLYDVVQGGSCLKCRNPREKEVSDEVIVNNLIRMSPNELEAEALRIAVDFGDLKAYLEDPIGNCGRISGTTLHRFASADDLAEWSVGFVSNMAGVLLAAEYLKMNSAPPLAVLNARRNAFRFQFWRPENSCTNAKFGVPVEASCDCQNTIFQRGIESLRMQYEAAAESLEHM